MIARLLSMFSGGTLGLKVVIYLLIFAVGWGLGNNHATERALTRELQASADRQRENHLVFFNAMKEERDRVRAQLKQQQDADKAAYDILERGKVEAERARQTALAALARERSFKSNLTEQVDGLRKVNEILASESRPNDPGCVMSGRVRGALDIAIATINHYPNPGNPEAPASTVSPGAGGTASVLACDELQRGFLDVLAAFGRLKARTLAGAAWADEALR